mmetsp:Transcript_17755/g.38924  ORF Transcript_17755/g.38924 Transcript_17755/m.38924 type:complete len:333 (-) Transcript_17755:46-1044(-)
MEDAHLQLLRWGLLDLAVAVRCCTGRRSAVRGRRMLFLHLSLLVLLLQLLLVQHVLLGSQGRAIRNDAQSNRGTWLALNLEVALYAMRPELLACNSDGALHLGTDRALVVNSEAQGVAHKPGIQVMNLIPHRFQRFGHGLALDSGRLHAGVSVQDFADDVGVVSGHVEMVQTFSLDDGHLQALGSLDGLWGHLTCRTAFARGRANRADPEHDLGTLEARDLECALNAVRPEDLARHFHSALSLGPDHALVVNGELQGFSRGPRLHFENLIPDGLKGLGDGLRLHLCGFGVLVSMLDLADAVGCVAGHVHVVKASRLQDGNLESLGLFHAVEV